MFTHKLRRAFIASVSVFGAAAAFSPAAFADDVNLQGEVASTVSMTAAATGDATTLNLGGEGTDVGEQIVKVADVALTTNNSTGLNLTVTSGNLTNGITTDDIAFQVVTVADAATVPASADFTTASGTNYTYDNSTQGDDPQDLYILYTPNTLQDPGTYEATITLTVADN